MVTGFGDIQTGQMCPENNDMRLGARGCDSAAEIIKVDLKNEIRCRSLVLSVSNERRLSHSYWCFDNQTCIHTIFFELVGARAKLNSRSNQAQNSRHLYELWSKQCSTIPRVIPEPSSTLKRQES